MTKKVETTRMHYLCATEYLVLMTVKMTIEEASKHIGILLNKKQVEAVKQFCLE